MTVAPSEGLADTIAAVATPPGRGGVGIVRVSGPKANAIASRLFRPWRARPPRIGPPRGRTMVHGSLIDPADGRTVDEILLLRMPGPATYTGEDVVEFHCHGSPRVLATVLRLTIELGARAAGPGEFTLRAFRNGRVDLTQAEAVMNLVSAETEASAKLAAAQAQGALGNALGAISERLVELAASIEAGIDFPDDEVEAPPAEDTRAVLEAVRGDLERLTRGAAAGRLLSAGAVVTIAGPTNAGKSSLFNALLGHERAIVSELPGTTRDVIEARVDWQGIPVTIRDTAGLRDPADPVETIGIRLAQQALHDADLVLFVRDVTADAGTGSLPAELAACASVILVENKIDLRSRTEQHDARTPCGGGPNDGARILPTSAATGEGVAALRDAIVEELTGGGGVRREATLLTTARQEREVRDALRHVDGALRALDRAVPPDVFLVEVYAAMGALAAARGNELADVREGVVEEVFSRFCVGK